MLVFIHATTLAHFPFGADCRIVHTVPEGPSTSIMRTLGFQIQGLMIFIWPKYSSFVDLDH